MQAEKLELVFRAQGSVGICDLLLALEDDLKRYEQEIREGKVKRMEESSDGLV